MRNLTILIVLIFSTTVLAASQKLLAPHRTCRLEPIRIGVLDTGFGFQDLGHTAKLCKYGHKDFSQDQQLSSSFNTKMGVPTDLHGHGTNIVGLIDAYASVSTKPYCFVIIKYFSQHQTGIENFHASIKALQYINNLKLDVVNYSGGGPDFSQEEYKAIKEFLDRGGLFVAAAGNENKLLDGLANSYYPAMYDNRIKVIGNKDIYGIKVPSSNYGPLVTTWENGSNRTAYGLTMTGTSQATAVTTGKYVARMNSCDR